MRLDINLSSVYFPSELLLHLRGIRRGKSSSLVRLALFATEAPDSKVKLRAACMTYTSSCGGTMLKLKLEDESLTEFIDECAEKFLVPRSFIFSQLAIIGWRLSSANAPSAVAVQSQMVTVEKPVTLVPEQTQYTVHVPLLASQTPTFAEVQTIPNVVGAIEPSETQSELVNQPHSTNKTKRPAGRVSRHAENALKALEAMY